MSMSQQPCLLCEADFGDRSALLQHIDEKHGGLQRYRNAMLMLESLSPHVVVGSEVRQYVRNYATFLREARIDWEGADDVSLRRRLGCCFCARSFWKEDLLEVFLAGQQCFMLNPDAVWKSVLISGALQATMAFDTRSRIIGQQRVSIRQLRTESASATTQASGGR